MNRSYSKIRHIQESNQKLEKRFIMEQTGDDYMILKPGETYDFIPAKFEADGKSALPKGANKVIELKVVSFENGNLTVNDGVVDKTYKQEFVNVTPKIIQRYFCLNGDKSDCILDFEGGYTPNGKILIRKGVLDFFEQDTEHEILFNESNFDELVLKSPIPVVVDFSAVWCIPCLRVGKILDEIKSTYQGKLVIGKVDLDMSKSIAKKYNIESIPVILIFKDGKQVERIDGAETKEFYIEKFNSVI